MAEDFLLLNPGPVPVTDEVLDSMSEPMVSHRSADFEAVYERAQNALDYIFTNSTRSGASTAEEGTSLIFNGTATMGMEAAVANLVGDGGNVVSLVNGKFGRRFARIADRYADVTRVEVEWGESIPVDAVEEAVTDDTDVVTMVHNETSTGLLNPAEAVGEVAKAHDATFVVDGVTSIGGDEFKIDDWNVDIAITDSQKALAAPPGVSAMYVTERVKDRIDGEAAPFYEDLDWHLRKAEQHQTPFTSAVPLFRALAVAVEDIAEETMPTRIERHRQQSAAFRAGFQAMGLELFANPEGETELSNTLTAVSLPEEVYGDDADEFFDGVTERNVSISGGQAHLGGQIFRVSNMGGLEPEHIVRGVRTVGEAMADAGVDVDVEAGVEAAEAELAEE
ncbi:alanine--glyoxylate aminotransferase family protein [Haloferax mediterranei ATCC 33500]|uniref:Alanine--glyoxylate aminotransferase family protein n=1 Tax=Haloferax mediterranei (strain ATCC 33500 / DSM 1411 / JCM 8866 / NBRC 14739 / NCIMB 2177 / R-4) TaxID=523841 RepID=I3R8X2_HALMT|nr:alanine--glyoxylate aminotransferase family protein [Haloferax mediterranei]AFK20682.1 aminotransferase class V (serine--pyruvate aminotransferase / alanine--glyoxylate aminotransferase) [Haloferax mediterranei ATCC 33500]AHZ22836.1 aspartate aminotransferase [Haloferax mediterranei ATCC 33500]EMA02998.1 aminotransferase class V (serine--pyruvate aminotransferase / alanine--glyoxylate aminotransferase) [Haloferax mediterranei ATCC 33500]MDX5987820.1 alanine--glyoxylate aminotransferase famil